MPEAPDLPLPAHDDPSAPTVSPSAEKGGAMTFASPLAAGQRWHSYQIGDQIETDTGWCYHAVDAGSLEDREIQVLPLNEQTAMRAQAWRELKSIEMPGLVQGIEASEEGEYRYEVAHPVPKTTLRAWAACRQASMDDVQALMQQVSDVLITLHDRGVVHLNLSPDTIYLLSQEEGLHVTLGGLQHVTVYNQPGLIPVPVDPLYAPPESAGLSKHSPGASLRAWDWWSLGRVVQEIILGRHVLSIVVNRDISRNSPELRSRAEALLLERDPRAPKAGAVELMPPMSQRLTDLLRGLLSSSRGGRWGTDEVLRWLKQQPVKDRYQLGRNEELFAWNDRVFTIEEAAEFFSREANWADGVANLFEKDDPVTLVSFLGERPEYRPLRERIDELHTFTQIPNWKNLTPEACRNALASAAWLLLGGEDAKLMLFGHRVDTGCLRALFARGVESGVLLVKALIAKPYIQLIEQSDPDAARLLATLAETVSSEAVMKATMDGWLDLTKPADYARLLLLVLEPERKLFELRAVLMERYACSREEHIQQLFKQPKLTRTELVLLASTAAQAERYGYVTHADWNRERHESLKQRGLRLVTALFWLRMGQAIRTGVVLFGNWKIVAGIWVGAASVAGWSSGMEQVLLWAVGALALAAGLKLLGVKVMNFLVRRHAPEAKPWCFMTGLERCREEASVVMSGEKVALTAFALGHELDVIRADMAALGLQPAPPQLPEPGWVIPAWGMTFAGWSLLVLLSFSGQKHHEMDAEALNLDPATAAAKAIEKAMKAATADTKLTSEDYFFGDPRKPRARWDVEKPEEAQPVPLAEVKAASSDDVAAVLIEGQRMLLSYQQNSVDALIAVPIEGKSGSGIMLYDGKNRRVIERVILSPEQRPPAQSWFEINKIKVFYPGPPPPPPPLPEKPVHDPQKPFDPKDLPEREIRRGAYQNVPLNAEQKTTNAQPLAEALDNMSP